MLNNEEKTRNWIFGAVGNIVAQHLDEEGVIRYGTVCMSRNVIQE